MKKILLTFLGVLLFVPFMVFADMGAPGIQSYKASVINKEGAIVYDQSYDEDDPTVNTYVATDKKVEYGKTVEITEEEDNYYLANDLGYLKASDLEPIQKNYTLLEKEWDSKIEGIILRKSEMRSGPANGYSKIGVTLEPGTKVTVRKYKNSDAMYSWVYVEYNGKKGYIDSYQGAVTLGKDKGYFMTFSDANFYDPKQDEPVGYVKANTVIEGTYYKLDAWSRGYYFEKSNNKGIIKYADLAERHKMEEGTLTKDVELYKYLAAGEAEIVTTLKKGTNIKYNISNYNFFNYIYYENGNIKGWFIDGEYDEDTGSTTYALKLKKTNNTNNYPIQESNTLDVVFEKKADEEVVDNDVIEPTTPEEPISPNNTEDIAKEEKAPIAKDKIYIYISGAVILFVVAIVTVLLVNRKKEIDE